MKEFTSSTDNKKPKYVTHSSDVKEQMLDLIREYIAYENGSGFRSNPTIKRLKEWLERRP